MKDSNEILKVFKVGALFKVKLDNIVDRSAVSRMRNYPGYSWIVIEPDDSATEDEIWLVPLSQKGVPMTPNIKNLIVITHEMAIYLYNNSVLMPIES